MAVVKLRGPLKQLAGGRAEHAARRRHGARGAARARARAARRCAGWILDERGLIRRHINVFVNGEQGRARTRPSSCDARIDVLPAISGGDAMTELLVGTQEGPVRARGRAGSGAFEVTARAFAGEPVEYAMRDPAAAALLASVDVALLRAEDLLRRRSRRRVGAGRGRRAARGRRPGARAHLDDRARRGRRTRCTPAATRACCSRAATAARRGSSTARCGSTPRGRDWQPGGGGLCLHSIVPWPGEPDRLALAMSAVGVWLTDDGGETWRNGNGGLSPRYLPERGARRTRSRSACTACTARRSGRSGCSCSSTAASTAPTTRARSWTDIGARPAVRLRLPADASTRPTPTART